MSPWTDHNGRACPIDPDAMARLRFVYNGVETKEPVRAGNYVWRRRGWDFDIAAYQVAE